MVVCVGGNQGCDADSSDTEWEAHIDREFGEAGRRRLEEMRNAGDAAVDVVEVIRETFGVWDDVRHAAADAPVERQRVVSPGVDVNRERAVSPNAAGGARANPIS